MRTGIDGIDHAVVAVADLAKAKAAYERLGFTTTPRRRMVGWGTANFSVMFDDKDFIELLGVIDPDAFLTPGLTDFLATGEGAMAVTMRANEVTAAHGALTASGADPTPLGEVTINCEADDGVVPQSSRWLKIGDAATPDMYLMVVQPLTPQSMRRPAWVSHANGARCIRAMTIVVDDPATLRPAYERLYGTTGRPLDRGFAIATGHGDFRFVTPGALAESYPGEFRALAHAAPTIVGITLETTDLAAAKTCLEGAGTPYRAVAGGLCVAPGATCGVILEFVAG